MVETPTHPKIACSMHTGLVAKPGQGNDSRHNRPATDSSPVKVSAGKSLNSGAQRRLAGQYAARFNAVTNRNYILSSGGATGGNPSKRPVVGKPVPAGTAHAAIARLDDTDIIVATPGGGATIVAQATANRRTSITMPHDARIDLRVNRVGARGASVGSLAGTMLRVSGERTYHADV